MYSALMTLLLSTAVAAPAPEGPEKPLRVLLAASGATREYQFTRTMLANEVAAGRAELSICLQGKQRVGVVQDVISERMLKSFPDKLESGGNDEAKYSRLGNYDLIIAFDFDWTELKPEQQILLAKWVRSGGGLIIVAGPLHMSRLSRPTAEKELKPILDLLPIIPGDNRLVQRSTDQPWQLNFPAETAKAPFLRLDGERKAALAGWDDFFAATPSKKGAKPAPTRGFYNYYPVLAVKAEATVLATYADPKAKLADGKEQPFLVSQAFGRGRVVWMSSGETWRLRQHSEAFHSRFWRLLSRYAASREQEKE